MKWKIEGIKTNLKTISETIDKISKSKDPNYTFCKCCGDYYLKSEPILLWHNYGGQERSIEFCSSKCVIEMIQQLGEGRAVQRKEDLMPFRLF